MVTVSYNSNLIHEIILISFAASQYKRKTKFWDIGNLKQVSADSKIKYSDAFTLITVDKDNVADFNYIFGIIPCIRKFIQHRKENIQLSYKELQKISLVVKIRKKYFRDNLTFLQTLEELDIFIEQCPTKFHRKAQKLIRESSVSFSLHLLFLTTIFSKISIYNLSI